MTTCYFRSRIPRPLALFAVFFMATISFLAEGSQNIRIGKNGIEVNGAQACLHDLCGPLESFPNHTFNIAVTHTAWLEKSDSVIQGTFPSPLPQPTSSLADVLNWIPQETEEEIGSPYRTTSLRLASQLQEIKNLIPYERLPADVSKDIFEKYIRATEKLHVLRAREFLTPEQARGFLGRFERLGKAMEETLVEEFGMPKEAARLFLSDVSLEFSDLSNCTEVGISLYSNPLSENEEEVFKESLKREKVTLAKIPFKNYRAQNAFARDQIERCFRAEQFNQRANQRYFTYEQNVDRIHSLLKNKNSSLDINAVSVALSGLKSFWNWNIDHRLSHSSIPSYGFTGNDVKMGIYAIQYPYYGEALIAHEYGHSVHRLLPDGSFIGINGKFAAANLEMYQRKTNACVQGSPKSKGESRRRWRTTPITLLPE